jgi:hypothetical protein
VDETAVRQRITAHARAIQAGNFHRAVADFADDASGRALLAQLPAGIRYVELLTLDRRNAGIVARIRCAGNGSEAMIEQRWQTRDGRLSIAQARVQPRMSETE